MDALETTDVERAFWAYDRTSAANVVVLVGLSGPGVAATPLLHDALEAVAHRHPYLRHTFSSDGRYLIPSGASRVGWRELEMGRGPSSSELVHEELHTPFELDRPPLIRATLLRENSLEASLLVTLAHPICDATGANWLVREALDEWDARVAGLPRLPHQGYRFLRPQTKDFPPRRSPEREQTLWGTGSDAAAPQALTTTATRSFVVARTLGAASTAALRLRAGRIGVSVNSLLTSQVVASLTPTAGGKPEATPVRITTAVNLRPLLPALSLTPQDLGMWAGRFQMIASVGRDRGIEAWARAFHDEMPSQRATAFEALRSLTASAKTGLMLKMSNHGDLDREGISAPLKSAQITSFRGFTPLHRGMSPLGGVGVIASRFGGRLDLSFVFAGPESIGDWSDALVSDVLHGLSAE